MGLIYNYDKTKHDVYLYDDEGPWNIFSTFIIPATGEKWNIPYRLIDQPGTDGKMYKYPRYLWDRDPGCTGPDNEVPLGCGVTGDKRKATPTGYNPNCIAFTNPINGIRPDFSGRDAPLRGAGSNSGEHPLHNMRPRDLKAIYEITGWPGSEIPGDDVFKTDIHFDPSIPGFTWEHGIRDSNVPHYKDILNINNWNNGIPSWFVLSKRHVLGCRHFIGDIPITERRTTEIQLIGKNNETYFKKIKPRAPTAGLPTVWYDFVIYEFVDDLDNPIDLTSEEQQQIKQYKLIDSRTIPAGVGLYKVNPSGTFAGLKTPAPYISGIDLSTGAVVWNDFDFGTNIDGSNFLSPFLGIHSGVTYNTKLIPGYPIYPFISNYNDQQFFIRKKSGWREPRGQIWMGHSSTEDKSFITHNGETYLTIPAFDLIENGYAKDWLKSIFEADGIENPDSRFVQGSYEPIQYATGYKMPLEPSPYNSRFRNPFDDDSNPESSFRLNDYTFNHLFIEDIIGITGTKSYQNVIWHGFYGAASLQSQELNEMQESIANQSSRYSNIMANWLEMNHENEIINGVSGPSGGFISESDPLVPLWPEYFSQSLNPRENEPGWYMIKDNYGFYHYCFIHNLFVVENLLIEILRDQTTPINIQIEPPCDYSEPNDFKHKAICLWNRTKYLTGSGIYLRYKGLRDRIENETLDRNGAHRIYSIQNINFTQIA